MGRLAGRTSTSALHVVNMFKTKSAEAMGAKSVAVSRSSSMTSIIKEGFLTKRALKSGRNWKRRYFALNGAGLAYFKQFGDKKPRGVISLESMQR